MSDKRLPDEKATMTYVSSYYHTFSGAQKVIPRLFLPAKDFQGFGSGSERRNKSAEITFYYSTEPSPKSGASPTIMGHQTGG